MVASGVSYLIYLFVYRVFRYRYAVIIENLSRSFPRKSQAEIEAYAREYYRHLGDLVVEPLIFVMVDDAARAQFARYTNTELLDKIYERGENVVALASHCGNWEYLINIPRVLKFKIYTAYTQLSNKVLDGYVLKLRSIFGVTLLPKQYFFRGALSVLKKENDPAIVVVIADQRPAPGSVKNFVRFLGQSTHVQIGAERLAMASGATMLFLECVKTRRFHYEFTFHVISEDAGKCMPMEITSAYYRMLEANILKSPSYWLWSHKRWKPLEKENQAGSLVAGVSPSLL